MCGFVGAFGVRLNKKKLAKAAKLILHRGPDNTTFFSTKNLSLTFNRLSIIDKKKRSNQPFIFDNIIVFANGEIFNYIELIEKNPDFKPKTSSDIEIIPFLYRKHGINFLHYLNGMFAIVLIDKKKQTSYFIRDRYGEKPFFYTIKKKIFYFSSEIKSLNSLLKLIPNKLNIKINFNYGFIPQPLTLYKDTYAIKPGHFIECKNNKITEKRWYELKNLKKIYKEKSISKLKFNFIKKFKNSILIRLRTDTKIGIFLSGGIDSNLIYKIVQKYFNEDYKKLHFFHCLIENKKEIENDTDINFKPPKSDNYYAATITPYYYNKNIVKVVDSLDFILLDSGTLIFYFLSNIAKRKGVKVVLLGSGGDELTGGYYWQNKISKIPNFILLIIFTIKIKIFYILSLLIKKNLSFISKALAFLASPLEWHVRTWNNSFGTFFNIKDKIKIFDKIYLLNKKLFSQIKKINIDFMNKFNFLTIKVFALEQHHKIDLATMNSSIEARTPFFDYNVVEMMMNIRHKIKILRGHKFLLKFFAKNIVDKNILKSPKSGPTLNLRSFYPKIKHNTYLKFIEKNKNIIVKYLGIFFYNKFIRNFSEKNMYLQNLPQLFALINFILWYKIKIENSINGQKDISLDKILTTA